VHSFAILGKEALASSLQQLVPVFIMVYLVWFLIKKDSAMNKMLLETIETFRQAEHSKDEFMANVSHEIRTPLNTICGMSELSLREELPPGIKENLFDIQVAGRNLQTIVSDVLDFSELETGKLAIVEESYNFTSILNDVLNAAIAQNEEKKLEIVVNYDVNLPCGLIGDSEKIRRIFSSLVDNAIKFTEKGCVTISVSGRREDYGINLCVNVKDTGIGMSQEDVEKIFTNFSQVDTKKNRQQTVIWLGIAITHKITGMMKGFLNVKSIEGAGSEFQFDRDNLEILDKTYFLTTCTSFEDATSPYYEIFSREYHGSDFDDLLVSQNGKLYAARFARGMDMTYISSEVESLKSV